MNNKQKDCQDRQRSILLSASDTENLFMLTLRKFGDKTLKNHDIISGKTPTDKGENMHKKQVCNRQQISLLWSRARKGA